MLLLYKSYNYINKHFFLIKSRVVGRGSRVEGRGSRGEGVVGVEGDFEIIFCLLQHQKARN